MQHVLSKRVWMKRMIWMTKPGTAIYSPSQSICIVVLTRITD